MTSHSADPFPATSGQMFLSKPCSINAAHRLAQGILQPALLLSILCLFSACGYFQPGIKAPAVPEFLYPAADTREMAGKIEKLTCKFQTLTAKSQALASNSLHLGSKKIILYAFFAPPDRIRVGMDDPNIGALLRVVQNGSGAAVHEVKKGLFFSGDVNGLSREPEAFFGIEPKDLARVLTPENEIHQFLRIINPPASLPKPSFWNKYHTLERGFEDNSSIRYEIHLADGLVREMTLVGKDGKVRFRAIYHAYQYYQGNLFPSEFDLILPKSGLTLRGVVEFIKLDRKIEPTHFSLEPPANLETRPLQEWIERMKKQ